MGLFFKLGWYFKAQWRRYAAAILMFIGVDVLEMSIPWITGRVIDHVLDQTLTQALLLRYVGIVATIALAVYVMRFFWRVFLFYSSFNLAETMRQRIFAHMTLMAPQFFQQHRTGDLMARATNDISAVEMTAGEGVLSGIDGLVTGVLVIAIMTVLISWELTLIALLPFPFMAWYFVVLGDRLHKGFRDAQERFSDLNDRVQESVSGIRMIRAFGREAREDEEFLRIADRAAEANIRVAATDSLYDPAIFITVGSSFMLCVGMGAWLVEQDRLTLGQLTSFTMYLGFLIWPMFAYGWLLNIVERGSAAYKRIEQLLQAESPVADTGAITQIDSADISFEIESFTHHDGHKPVLKNIFVQVRGGETLGIVGPTGAGKTTLINVLQRYFDAPHCTVKIGGTQIQQLSLQALRSAVALVPQDPFLFTATIAENIALGKPDATREQIRAVAQLASIDKDILRFPAGYDTLVGERGITLSGGQKQRIAIARALLLDAPILILDDALSAVDVGTERSILAHLREVRVDRTTLVLCHRLSAVEYAQQIIVLNHGEIAERGTHRELMTRKGWYAQMIDYQKLEQAVESGR
ncbi:MAG: ABC transporter transmembrane domain-containing protein [Gammaproteobacteria bacterium]|nr:ABC transporter transmembrane domain-containing protein [Gammaproteobacteria bacterium]MDP2348347.1 ABC transporter transmembrane domain-containing protein [Gammaproteobacteria bacterium]